MVRNARHEKGNLASFADEVLVDGGELDHFVKPDIHFVNGDQKPGIVSFQLFGQPFHARSPVVGRWALSVNRMSITFGVPIPATVGLPSGSIRWAACLRVRISISSSIPGSAVVLAAIHPCSSALLASKVSSVVLPVPLAPEMIVVSSGLRRSLRKARVRSAIISLRPARWAGISPKLGVNGFSMQPLFGFSPIPLSCSKFLLVLLSSS